jgi:virginiamycin B lyase
MRTGRRLLGCLVLAVATCGALSTGVAGAAIKTYNVGAQPGRMVKADGAMWFTEFGRDRLGRVTGTGQFSEYQLPAGSRPYGIVGGADGAICTTLWGKGGQVARVTTDTPTVASAARRAAAKRKAKHHKKATSRTAR